MIKFKALYKGMYDDLKDSEMMIDYACEIREDKEDGALADEIAKYASYRLSHFMEFHKLFEAEAQKQKTEQHTMTDCLWCETHEQLQDWYDKIKKKIEKY